MTFAGKILVIVIMALSLVILGVSTAALVTATDWKKAIADQNKANGEIQAQLTTVTGERDAFKAKFDVAKKEHDSAVLPIEAQIKKLQEEDRQGREAIKAAQETLLKHQSETKTTLEDVQNKNKDIVQLRAEVDAVNEQARKFRQRQEEIDAEIVNLHRMLDAAKTNANQVNKSP
jgi:chromosome segregation ATPase